MAFSGESQGGFAFCGFYYKIKVVVTQPEARSIFMAIIIILEILINFLN